MENCVPREIGVFWGGYFVFTDITNSCILFGKKEVFFLANAPTVPVISVLPGVTSHSVTPISVSFKQRQVVAMELFINKCSFKAHASAVKKALIGDQTVLACPYLVFG